ncbi:MAG: response regulator [Clostridia bacterium]|jgi:two-component system response regulator DctR|nr:response regulator [Clostridia bacterium]
MIGIVIVEDDPMVLEVNKQYIEAVGGFKILATADHAAEGLELVRRFRPQLLLLDIFLPDQKGIEVLQEMRRLDLPTDVILVTAARDVETIQQGFRYGIVDYIVKPFRFERIKSSLESYRDMYYQLQRKEALNQAEIDDMGLGKVKIVEETLPKGLTETTLKQVMLFLLKGKQSYSAEEVASEVGLSRVTARRYLEYLEKTGKAELELQYGSVGRPVNRYRIR